VNPRAFDLTGVRTSPITTRDLELQRWATTKGPRLVARNDGPIGGPGTTAYTVACAACSAMLPAGQQRRHQVGAWCPTRKAHARVSR
jgi:hypothetical protein